MLYGPFFVISLCSARRLLELYFIALNQQSMRETKRCFGFIFVRFCIVIGGIFWLLFDLGVKVTERIMQSVYVVQRSKNLTFLVLSFSHNLNYKFARI